MRARRLRRGLGARGSSPNSPVGTAIVTRPSSGARGPRPAPPISVPATYGAAIAPPLPAGFDVVAVRAPTRRPRSWLPWERNVDGRTTRRCRANRVPGLREDGRAERADRARRQGLDLGAGAPLSRMRVRRRRGAARVRGAPAAGQRRRLAARAAATRRRGAPAPGRRPLVRAGVRLPRARRLRALPPAARSHAARGRPALPELGPGRHGGRGALRRAGSRRRLGGAASRPRPRWPTASTACGASNGSGPDGAATAPASASRGSAATCSTTQSIIFTTSPGIGGPEPRAAEPLNRGAVGRSRARGRRWPGRSCAGPTPGRPW